VPNDIRARMVETAATLLAQRGVQATSFGEVLKLTGGSRGSLYHHFPGGKAQLVEEAVASLRDRAFAPMEQYAGASAEEITKQFLALWRSFISGFELQGGCVMFTVTVTTDSAAVIAQTADAFRAWRTRLAELLTQGGFTQSRATAFAATLVAAVEGALVIARAERSMEPYDTVATHLLDQARLITEAQEKV
jgi:TetR/AcrR family transcriptional repressor of lmrAB and yxaGH operons